MNRSLHVLPRTKHSALVVAVLLVAVVACKSGGAHKVTPQAPAGGRTEPVPAAAVTTSNGSPGDRTFYSVDFVNREMGWAAGAGGIFATRDGGKHWTRQYDEQGASSGRVQFLDEHVGYADTVHGLFATTDGGANWVPTGYGTGAVRFEFVTPQDGWALLSKHFVDPTATLLRTNDSGHSFQEVLTSQVGAFCFGDTSVGWVVSGVEVKRTEDASSTWVDSFMIPSALKLWVPTSYCAGHDVAWLLLTESPAANRLPYVLFRTTDGGSSWQPVMQAPTGPAMGAQVGAGEYPGPLSLVNENDAYVVGSCYQCASTHPEVREDEAITCGTGTGDCTKIEATHDGGVTWDPPVPVPGAGSFPESLDFVDASHGWLASGNGVFATADGGKTWSDVTPTVGSP